MTSTVERMDNVAGSHRGVAVAAHAGGSSPRPPPQRRRSGCASSIASVPRFDSRAGTCARTLPGRQPAKTAILWQQASRTVPTLPHMRRTRRIQVPGRGGENVDRLFLPGHCRCASTSRRIFVAPAATPRRHRAINDADRSVGVWSNTIDPRWDFSCSGASSAMAAGDRRGERGLQARPRREWPST